MNSKCSRIHQRAFSLVELLVVMAIVIIIVAASASRLPGIFRSTDVSNNINELADFLRQARSVAMAGNTYVWVGFLPVPANTPGNQSGTDEIVLAAVSAKDSQASDLASGNLVPVQKGLVLKGLVPKQFDSQVLVNSGRETTGVDDISSSNLDSQFSQAVGGISVNGNQPVFKELIQFGPQGSANIKNTASRWIEIGLQASQDKSGANIAVLQINGLVGQVRIFRP